MIPRYAPTYTYADLVSSLKIAQSENLERDLRSQLSKLLQVKYVFLLANARAGIYTILKAYNRPGRVLMPAYNCIVVPEAVNYAGYQPEFVDIDISTLNVSAGALEKAMTPNTTTVLLTHIFGIPCELEEIRNICRKRNILFIEDAAPAFGAEIDGNLVGSFGDASVISFHSTKVVSGGGGGALITNNDVLAEAIDKILSKSQKTKNISLLFFRSSAYKIALNATLYAFLRFGYRMIKRELMYEVVKASLMQPNGYISRMPAYTCALISSQLNRLERNLNRRRMIAKTYTEQLGDNPNWTLPKIPKTASPAWIQFPLICHNKAEFYKFMQSKGVDMSWSYKYSCAESFGLNNYPFSQKAAKKVVSLPTSPNITEEQAHQICSKALGFLPSQN